MSERILIVDDEKNMARAIAKTLQRKGYQCLVETDGFAALETIEHHDVDLVLTDLRMPRMDGLALMDHLHQKNPGLPVILMTAYGGIPSAVSAIKEGAFDYVTKPFDHAELHALVARALRLRRLERENRELRQRLQNAPGSRIIAESQAMKEILAMVDRAAPSQATILITGESGTGKEVIAKRVHLQSSRVGKPFLAVNCKAFAEGVLESELFGHERGAFTGATSTRMGCFERAHSGTLFLDEIGETQPSFQAKLLRVLQEREIQRVGGNQARKIDVRLIAATNQDLKKAVREGRFREDLFFRLNVIPMELPPLRRRPADILPLADHFLQAQAVSTGRPFTLSEDALELLRQHSWPGNVRELENTIERATVLTRTGRIEPEDLLLDTASLAPNDRDQQSLPTLQHAMDLAAKQAIQKALHTTGNRKAEAAVLLGIERTTLYRLMKKLGFSQN